MQQFVRLTLNHGVFESITATTIGGAREAIRDNRPSLLIVDLDLKEHDPSDLIGLRIKEQQLPTIALTRRGNLKTKLAAFEHGVDDIITLPVSPDELVARVFAVMRRSYGSAVRFVPVIKVGDLRIDLLNQVAYSGSSRLRLTTLEQALLYFLASAPERVVTREDILDAVWGMDYVAESNVVDRHVRSLRIKLKNDWRHPRFIATVPGRGYRFLVTPAR